MQTDLLSAALAYADLGYRIFPAVPGEKRPLVAHGLKEATTDEATIEAWWTATPTANICLSTDGLLVVDVDGANNPWLTHDRAMELASAPISRTASGGWHYLFRQPDGVGCRNTASKIGEKVDTRADGGYIVVPPSVLNGDLAYKWATELDVSPDKLPLPPQWVVELLTGAKRRPNASTPVNISTPATGLERAIDFVDDEPIAVSGRGGHNQTFHVACELFRYGLTESEASSLLSKYNRRCDPPWSEGELAHKLADARLQVIASGDYGVRLRQGILPVAADREPSDAPGDPGRLPPELMMVPGFVADVMGFNLSGAYKPQPELALAGALALLAVLTGRKITDPYGTRTNLYTVGVAGSGAGKERAREVNKSILFEAGLDRLIGPESIGSSAGLITAVQAEPSILFQLDEIGRLLKTLGDARQSHLYGIVTALMKLFTSSGSLFIGDAYADAAKVKKIYQPSAVVYGTTVPQSLYEGLTAESLTDGFLSRMLIFTASDNDPEPQQPVSQLTPKKIVETARYWGDLKTGGNVSHLMPTPLVVPYSDAASEVMSQLEESSRDERRGRSETIATLWTRVTEKARKLALLYACSENHIQPIVSRAGAEWSAALSCYLTRSLLFVADAWIAENPFQAKCKRVLRIIRATGPVGMRKRELIRATQFLTKKEREEALDMLLTVGDVVETFEDTATKPASRYVAPY